MVSLGFERAAASLLSRQGRFERRVRIGLGPLVPPSACQGFRFLSLALRLCFLLFESQLLLLHLIVRVGSILEDLASHRIDVLSQRLSIVFQILKPNLKLSALVVPLEHFLLSLSNGNLADLVFLLKIDNELVLSLNDGLVFFKHFLGLLGLALIIGLHV